MRCECGGTFARYRIAGTLYVFWRCEDCGEFHPHQQAPPRDSTGTEDDS